MAGRSQADVAKGGAQVLLRTTLSNMEKVYLSRNPTAKAIVNLIHSADGGGHDLCYDHFFFRTLGVDGYGIDSIANFFLDFGYVQREEMMFPAKKIRALWFAPPAESEEYHGDDDQSCLNGPLPRIVAGVVLFDELSPQSQDIIRKYTKMSGEGNKYSALTSILGCLPWEKPIYSDFQQLARESEFAAWALVNGYLVNHVTISAHRLESDIKNINILNQFIEDQGFKLSTVGGILKVSPDGLLLQSATIADSALFTFADGVTETIPSSYIEFAERRVLPQYENLADEEIKELHRRDGFEVGNAYGIMESTSKEQLARKVAVL